MIVLGIQNSELYVISNQNISSQGPLKIYHNNIYLGQFKQVPDSESYSTALNFVNTNTSYGPKWIFTITPEMLDKTSFEDGIWHTVISATQESYGDIKMDCAWCKLSKLFNNNCDTQYHIQIATTARAYMIVAEAAMRMKNYAKAVRMYNLAMGILNPLNCNC